MTRTPTTPPTIDRAAVVRLWLHRQGLARPRGHRVLSRASLVEHLEGTGALQLDPINVVDRAHHLTLWSRFGAFDHQRLAEWVYESGAAYEYWGHAASILPASHLPLSRRRMCDYPPKRVTQRAYWEVYSTSPASRRNVLQRLRHEGPLESADFERRPTEPRPGRRRWLPKEDRRSLKLLWHAGEVAVRTRRSFRCVYDLAERVYPETPVASPTEYQDAWLRVGLAANGIASEAHLDNYWTAPGPTAADRRRIIMRNLEQKTIVEVRVAGLDEPYYALPEHLDRLRDTPEPHGTTLLCPFDSLLWQRRRAEDLLDFRYRVEIYVPRAKREYGYYVLPILHDGRLVGRLDPKLHRKQGRLEIQSLWLEPDVELSNPLATGLRSAFESLAEHVGARTIEVPDDWSRRLVWGC